MSPHKNRTVGKSYLLSLLVLALGLEACQREGDIQAVMATVEKPVASPSGKFSLALLPTDEEGQQAVRFQIRDQAARPLFTSTESFAVAHRTYVLWDSAERVWVYSGDVGTYFWTRRSDSSWERQTWAGSNVEPPAPLKAAVPKRFGK